jgi:hypothetical protein
MAVALFATEAEITVLEPFRLGFLKIGLIISAPASGGRRSGGERPPRDSLHRPWTKLRLSGLER